MKCQYCNSNLSLEDAVCPGCGKINEQAKKHVEEMNRYKKEFESTKADVLENTKRYTAVSVRILLISVLVVLGIIFMIMGGNSYTRFRNSIRKEAVKRFDEYNVILTDYLDHHDYQSFLAFMENRVKSSYDSPYEGTYSFISSLSSYYCEQQAILFRLISDPGDRSSRDFENFCNCANFIFEYYENSEERYTKYNPHPEVFLKYSAQIKEDFERELVTYFGFSKEEIESLSELSKAKRTVLFEEKWEEIRGNEQ